MLRTILLRNQVLNDTLKKTVRSNFTRCISTELSRRKLSHKLLITSNKRSNIPQWSQQIRYYADLPSHTKVPLPALSPTMESGTIISWSKKEGDKLDEGELLCEIETDKATMGFETPEEGYLAKIIIPAGAKGVPVGRLLCIIVDSSDKVAAFKDFKDDASAPAAAAAPAAPAPPAPPPPRPAPAPAAAAPAPTAAAAAPSGGRLYASPFAKRIAELKNIRLGGTGSGLYNSVKSGDLSGMQAGAAPAPPAGATYEDIPLSGMRATIAKRLSIAKQTIPHYQLSITVNLEKTIAMRKKINDKLAAEKRDLKVSVNDFIIKAVAGACKRVPSVNAHWMETYVRQFQNVDVSVAVATPTGLITPILFNADSRGILDLSKDLKILAVKAKEGKLQPSEFQGGTVTVSNLGMYGITMFNAIINPPQSLILACGGIQEVVIPAKEGFQTAKFVTFTASADHRVIDGAVGAVWMRALQENLEDPANIIL